MKVKVTRYSRLGKYIVKKNNDGSIISLFRFDDPYTIYVPKRKMSIKAASMRESRGTLEKAIKVKHAHKKGASL